ELENNDLISDRVSGRNIIRCRLSAIYSSSHSKIYIGQTDNLERRLFEHNNGLLSTYTKRYKPCQVVYKEDYETRSEALKREKQLKSQKGREFMWRMIKDKIAGSIR
ncbi:MAG: GIY-YIG nuclease family protein, partial [Ignavibacteriaceae bacterium]|nr:GIY-YIG nuclease family protein [Ignavibacteriaceae bacterium]